MDGNVIGKVTSGGPSPTLGRNIAMGYVPPAFAELGTRPEGHRARQARRRRGRRHAVRRPTLLPQTESLRTGPMHFTKDHEWVRLDGDIATVGISKHAADALGDVVFVETPDAGKTVSKGDSFAVVESVKAASDVYAPVSGEVIEGNAALAAAPETVNADPEGEGWFAKIKVVGRLAGRRPDGPRRLRRLPGHALSMARRPSVDLTPPARPEPRAREQGRRGGDRSIPPASSRQASPGVACRDAIPSLTPRGN